MSLEVPCPQQPKKFTGFFKAKKLRQYKSDPTSTFNAREFKFEPIKLSRKMEKAKLRTWKSFDDLMPRKKINLFKWKSLPSSPKGPKVKRAERIWKSETDHPKGWKCHMYPLGYRSDDKASSGSPPDSVVPGFESEEVPKKGFKAWFLKKKRSVMSHGEGLKKLSSIKSVVSKLNPIEFEMGQMVMTKGQRSVFLKLAFLITVLSALLAFGELIFAGVSYSVVKSYGKFVVISYKALVLFQAADESGLIQSIQRAATWLSMMTYSAIALAVTFIIIMIIIQGKFIHFTNCNEISN